MHESDSLMIANQIQGLGTEVPGGLAMSFGDIRVARRADWMIERVAAMGTVVLRQLGETRAGEMRVCRFLSSPPFPWTGSSGLWARARRHNAPVAASWQCKTPPKSILPVARRSDVASGRQATARPLDFSFTR